MSNKTILIGYLKTLILKHPKSINTIIKSKNNKFIYDQILTNTYELQTQKKNLCIKNLYLLDN